MIPLVDLQAQYLSIKDKIDAAILRTVQSGQFVMGKQVEQFENEFAKFCGANFCVGTSSGTSALQLAIRAAGIGRNDEVITVPNTFIATTEAVVESGALFRFVDVDEETQNMDVDQLEGAITEKTKALLPVHLFGQACDMGAIKKIAADHNLVVIEDAAQAHGTEYKGERIPVTDIGCFSFFPAKILGAYGDAGAVVTNDREIAETVRNMRNHGRKPGSKYEHGMKGLGERMDELQAAVLSVKLPYLDQWIKRRREIARRYSEALQDMYKTPLEKSHGKHAFYVYTIRSPSRDALQQHLRDRGIASQIYYPMPLHLQQVYAEHGFKPGDFPVTEKLASEILSLPMYPELTEEQINTVIEAVRSFS